MQCQNVDSNLYPFLVTDTTAYLAACMGVRGPGKPGPSPAASAFVSVLRVTGRDQSAHMPRDLIPKSLTERKVTLYTYIIE